MNEKEGKHIGVILSGATTREALCQLLELSERGKIREGMLLLIESATGKLLARVAQIVPYNAFYTEGDAFSEPRRKGLPIPEDVARRYEMCQLDLLIKIEKNKEISYPPQPGDLVSQLNPALHEKDIFGVARGEKEHVWFGSLSGYPDAPIPLNVENIPMHMAIFGVTGSGKSFDAGALIEKLVEIPVGTNTNVSYPMILIDAHGDYIDYVEHVQDGGKLGSIGWIKRFVFPSAYTRPDLRRTSYVQPIGINLDLISQRELAEIIVLMYKGTTEGAELQVSGIDSLFDWMRGVRRHRSLHDVFLLNFDDLTNELFSDEFAEETGMAAATRSAIDRELKHFRSIETKYNLLSTKSELRDAKKGESGIETVDFIENITKQGGVVVVDFSADGAPGVELQTKQFIMTYLATLLFEQFTNYKIKQEERYLMFIIEEAQNFCPDKSYPVSSSLAHSRLSAIATQGRKFGLSLCLISQRPSFVDRIVLSMCNTFLIHRVSPEDVSFVRSVTGGLPSSLVSRLTTLDKGEVIVTGQMNKVPFPLTITVSGQVPGPDRKVKHTIGKTRVCESLVKQRGIKT